MAREADPDRGSSAGQEVGSVARALSILRCFENANARSLGVSEIARSIGVAKSTASRLLRTLQGAGLVCQDAETAQYSLGIRLFELGQLAASRFALRSAARSVLYDVCAETGLTAALVIPSPQGIVHLERAEPPAALALWTERGSVFPSCGAGGIVIAAHRRPTAAGGRSEGHEHSGPVPEGQGPARYRRPPGASASTGRQHGLDDVRAAGHALEFGHVIPGIASLAVPIHELGAAVGAIAVIGPDRSFQSRAVINRLVSLTALAGRTVERQGRGMRMGHSEDLARLVLPQLT